MKQKALAIIVIFLMISGSLSAQSTEAPVVPIDKYSFGFGAGLDYGGLGGGNFLFYPHQNIGFFGGVGYALAGMGFNAGVKGRLVNKMVPQKARPYIMAMYGYNTAIVVDAGTQQYEKLFYNFSFGLGIDLYTKLKKNSNFWSFAVIIPVRGSEVQEYIDSFSSVKFENKLYPVVFSIGWHKNLD